MQSLPRVLLVEDDRSIASALAQALQNTYEMDVAATGRLALYKTDTENYDVIVLDLSLPDMTGIDICQLLRERGNIGPILILTADGNVMSKIKLLDAGANDYLTKPFSLGELKARLRAMARPAQLPIRPGGKLIAGDLELDRQTYRASRQGVSLDLRRKEFALLECLMEHAGSVVTRQMLIRYAWHGADELWTNTVDVHIKHLRDKLDRPFDRPLIRTVHGLGYKLEALPALIAGKN